MPSETGPKHGDHEQSKVGGKYHGDNIEGGATRDYRSHHPIPGERDPARNHEPNRPGGDSH
jgi:hypothetical protein